MMWNVHERKRIRILSHIYVCTGIAPCLSACLPVCCVSSDITSTKGRFFTGRLKLPVCRGQNSPWWFTGFPPLTVGASSPRRIQGGHRARQPRLNALPLHEASQRRGQRRVAGRPYLVSAGGLSNQTRTRQAIDGSSSSSSAKFVDSRRCK